MAKWYKLHYINKIMLFLSSKGRDFEPRNLPLGAPLAQILSRDAAQGRVNLLKLNQQLFYVIYVYFSLKCKVKIKSNQEKKFLAALIPGQAGNSHKQLCAPQNLRPRTGDYMRPE